MLGLPYMGSKRKLAERIVKFIRHHHPTAEYFYDLFGGGGAVSFAAAKYGFRVIYNEKNIGVSSLMRQLRIGLPDSVYKWVSREQFHEHRNDNDWYGGYIQTVWSFGNDQRTYLYGSDIEGIKRAVHHIIVDMDYDALETLLNEMGHPERYCHIKTRLSEVTDIDTRRLIWQSIWRRDGADRLYAELEHLQRINSLGALCEEGDGRGLLPPLSPINSLTAIKCGSYDEVEIRPNSVVYLDPPYDGTEKYREDIFHDELYEWAKSLDSPCYMSEYSAPFVEVARWSRRDTRNSTDNTKIVTERLFRCDQGRQ